MEHCRRDSRKNVRVSWKMGGAWQVGFRTGHSHWKNDFTIAEIVCIGPAWRLGLPAGNHGFGVGLWRPTHSWWIINYWRVLGQEQCSVVCPSGESFRIQWVVPILWTQDNPRQNQWVTKQNNATVGKGPVGSFELWQGWKGKKWKRAWEYSEWTICEIETQKIAPCLIHTG